MKFDVMLILTISLSHDNQNDAITVILNLKMNEIRCNFIATKIYQ